MIHPWDTPSKIVKHNLLDKCEAFYTVVMPVFNHEEIIETTLNGLFSNSKNFFSLIIILDAPEDESLSKIEKFVGKSNCSKLCSVTYIINETPIFETACDNQGFRLAKTKYILELQADIIINDFGFDVRMISALEKYSLASISGRHVHYFSVLDSLSWFKYPIFKMRSVLFKKPILFGKYGNRIFKRSGHDKNIIVVVGETVARGPWMLRKKDLKDLDYLDEVNFFLGNDDHDFHRRMYLAKKMTCGYVPMDVYSPERFGSTRQERHGVNKEIYNWLSENKKGSADFLKFIRTYRPFEDLRKITKITKI